MEKTYICHSGIKGMRWGIRRFQNEDGTLNDAGKARYHSDGRKKTAENMSDKELLDSTNRFNNERNYYKSKGDFYRTGGSIKDVGVKTLISGLGTGVLTTGTLLVRNAMKQYTNDDEGKAAKKADKGKAIATGILSGVAAASVSAATNYGGKINHPKITRD